MAYLNPAAQCATAQLAFILLTAVAWADQETAPKGPLSIGPRWETMWLSPDLAANWVMMECHNPLPKDKVASAVLTMDLPPGVKCLWAGKLEPKSSPAADGRRTILTFSGADLSMSRSGYNGEWFYFSTSLSPGSQATGRVWAEWKGGKSTVAEFPIEVIAIRDAGQPKQIRAGVTLWPYQIGNWPGFADQFADMGFNHVYYWHGLLYSSNYKLPHDLKPDETLRDEVAEFRDRGIITSVVATGTWDFAQMQMPEAQALFATGKRRTPCPSYRGPGFTEAVEQNCEKVARSGVSYILSDEEYFATRGFTIGQDICLCDRCEKLWAQWLPVHRPDLERLPIGQVIQRRDELPEHMRAWWYFRASLTTQRYRTWRNAFVRAVEEHGAKSSPTPMLGWCCGGADVDELRYSMIDSRAIADVTDVNMPQIYYRYKIPPRDFRAIVRRHCWAMDRRDTEIVIDSDDHGKGEYANIPGILLTGVLESVFAGASGYLMWNGPYIDTRQWAELADANHAIAKFEDVFLEGRENDLFRSFVPDAEKDHRETFFAPWSNNVCTSTWENDRAGVLLVTDYRQDRKPVWVERSRQYTGPLTLYDAFTDEKIAHLTTGQWDFYLEPSETMARLLYWEK
jgi:hypothetical protein